MTQKEKKLIYQREYRKKKKEENNLAFIIYKFTNKINNKCYIGVTNIGFDERKKQHIHSSKKPKYQFHKAIKKYGIDSFLEEILEKDIKTKKLANKLEIYYINLFNSYKNGYNMTEGGGLRGNFKHTEETKEKMSNLKLGIKLSAEHKNKISNSLKGKPKSKEHNAKVGLANKGKLHSNETLLKISEKLKGKLSGNKNPAAITIQIYNSKNELIFLCNGNFESVCKENNLPLIALRKSYYNVGKPIYEYKFMKKDVMEKFGIYKNWYAVRLQQTLCH